MSQYLGNQYLESKFSIKEIMQIPIGELANYNPSRLYILHEQMQINFEQAKRLRDWIESAINLKYEEKIRAKRLRLEKDSGVVHLEEDGFKISCDLPRKIEWDQRKLQIIIASMMSYGANINDFVETIYHVPERKYNSWSESMKKEFMPARIVKHGRVKYKLTKIENDEVLKGKATVTNDKNANYY